MKAGLGIPVDHFVSGVLVNICAVVFVRVSVSVCVCDRVCVIGVHKVTSPRRPCKLLYCSCFVPIIAR